MNPNDVKLLDAARRLRYIPRLSTNPLLRSMNVAEHSFGVALLAYLLLKEQMENTKAVAEDSATCILEWRKRFNTLVDAVTHDVPEGVTGDVLYSTKRDNPNMAREIAAIEARVSKELFDDEVHELSNDQIVKAADMTELLINLEEEMELGNTFPNIQAVWFFSLAMVWRFQVRMQSEVLKHVVTRCKERLPGQHLFITAASVVLGAETPKWRVIHGESGELYTGFKGIIERVTEATAAVLKRVDADKRLSWAVLVENSTTKARYFGCRVNTNFEERVILYHVSGPRHDEIEANALETITNE